LGKAEIEDMITIRHEDFYEDPKWGKDFHSGERLTAWIRERLPQIGTS